MRIYYKNLIEYLGTSDFITQRVYGYYPLLQANYGEENDCTLTSMTVVLKYFLPSKKVIDIYNKVEEIAKRYGYKGDKGTQPIVMKKIFQEAMCFFEIPKDVGNKYLKGICYSYKFLKQQIDLQQPVILNLYKDGNNYYQNHTVLIIGYCETSNKKMLIVYDNWNYDVSYIDYDKLSMISSILYFL